MGDLKNADAKSGSLRYILLIFSILILSLACKHERSLSSKARGYVQDGKRTLWASPSNIPVCWENLPSSESPIAAIYARNAKMIEETVVTVYQELGFVFTGWGECIPHAKGIRIAIKAEVPRVADYGARLDGLENGMVLNFMDASCRRTNREYCLKSQAVHEFGHALGLNHEMNRPDSTCRYGQATTNGEAGAIAVGDYDARSVMDYCYIQRQMAQGLPAHELSEGDKQTLRMLYSGEIFLRDLTESDICQDMHRLWNLQEGCCETYGVRVPELNLPICLSPEHRCQLHAGEWRDNEEIPCCGNAKAFNEAGQQLYKNYEVCRSHKKERVDIVLPNGS